MRDSLDLYSLLTKAGCDDHVIAHCETVRKVALSITDQILAAGHARPDRDLVAAGALLHDIGRSQTHSIHHGVAGAEYCRRYGVEEAICLIIERHIGGGLTAFECESAGLSPIDRIPLTLEEQIVAHADNLVRGTRVITIDERVKHSQDQKLPGESIARIVSLAEKIEMLCIN